MVDRDSCSPPDVRTDATTCLKLVATGDAAARARLAEIVYGDLQRIAGAVLRNERPGHTLQPTALVHEAWLRLIDQDASAPSSRTHFLAVAAQAMRRVVLDHARRRSARVEGARRTDLADEVIGPCTSTQGGDLEWTLDLDSALDELARRDPRKARVVELHVFGGLALDEVASIVGVSAPTVDRDWAFARAWLKTKLRAESGP